MSETGSKASVGFSLRGILPSIIVNAAIPTLLYSLAKSQFGASELIALSIAAVFPLIGSVVGLIRQRRMDVIGVLALLGIAVSMVGIALGGNPKILLIRESFVTGALGIACFISLLMPKPLMYYFGRDFAAAGDKAKAAAFDAEFKRRGARRAHRLITMVWGFAFAGEFVLRVIMVLTLPSVVVLAISPIILGLITIATITWTFAYVRSQAQALQDREALDAQNC